MISGIYKITNIVNGKIIIGQTINFHKRWRQYKCLLKKNKHSNSHLQHAWNKYGEQSFRFEVILECPKEKLDEKETKLIQKYKSNDKSFGYNIEAGGNYTPHTQETKDKIRQSLLGRKHSKESKIKMSRSHIANFNEETREKLRVSHLGKTLSEEHKQKIRESIIGRKLSKETRRKLSIIRKGKKLSREHKIKISKANKGKIISEETRRKMSISQQLRKPASKETRQKISNALMGHKVTKETRQKLRKANLRRCLSEKHRRKIKGSILAKIDYHP